MEFNKKTRKRGKRRWEKNIKHGIATNVELEITGRTFVSSAGPVNFTSLINSCWKDLRKRMVKSKCQNVMDAKPM
ncbi:MAG: hypothetical protein V3U92_19695 [Cellulophaga sp.]